MNSLLVDNYSSSVELVPINSSELEHSQVRDACYSLTYRPCCRASPPVEETSTHTVPQKLARFPELGVPHGKTFTELYFEVRRCLEYLNTGCVRRVSLYQLRNVHEGHAKVVNDWLQWLMLDGHVAVPLKGTRHFVLFRRPGKINETP